MKKEGLQFDLFNTYLAAIKNSVGSKFFRNMYAYDGRKRIDVLENGNLSCAYFVSTILKHFGLLKKVHATVKNTVKDLKRSGGKSGNKPKNGSVLVYPVRSPNMAILNKGRKGEADLRLRPTSTDGLSKTSNGVNEEKYFPESGNRHMHIGFYIGRNKAISTSSKYRTPIIHGWQKEQSSGKPRKVIEILSNK